VNKKYGVAVRPTPILNTPHFLQVFRWPLPLDSQNLLRAVEAVAFPGTKFCILEDCGEIAKVSTAEYSVSPQYVDYRFLQITSTLPPERERSFPSSSEIVMFLRACLGLPYVWGGNWSQGIEEMLAYYPPNRELDPSTRSLWQLKGVDCSGLLFEATRGCTPRNTSQLVHYGNPVAISGLCIAEIVAQLQPLDLIVWVGHVIIVEDKEHTIESRNPEGVIRSSLHLRLKQILLERRPVDHWMTTWGPRFVIRRFL